MKLPLSTLLAILLISNTLSATLPHTELKPGQWLTLEVESNLMNHLKELPEHEQMEQVRDWIVFAFFNEADVSEDTYFAIFYDYSPLRQEFKRSFIDYWYGESRSIALENGDLYVFVPEGSPENKVHIARAADEYRMVYDQYPERAFIVEYRLDLEKEQPGQFALQKELDGKALFSSDYGYLEKAVSGVNELEALLPAIDDVTFVSDRGDKVLIGGRKFADFPTRGVTLEHVAALYQADNNLAEEFRKRVAKRGLRLEYENWVKENVEYNLRLNPLRSRSSVEYGFRQQYDYNYFYQEQMQQFMQQDLNIGFSLDPDLQEAEFTADLKRILVDGDEAFFRQWFDEYQRDQMASQYLLELSRLNQQLQAFGQTYSDNTLQAALTEERESSFESFLKGHPAEGANLEYDQLINRLQQELEVSDEEIEEYVEGVMQSTLEALRANQDILLEVADSVADNKMLPYYRYKTYLDGLLPFELTPEAASVGTEIQLKGEESAMRDLLMELYLNDPAILSKIDLDNPETLPEQLYKVSRQYNIDTDKYFTEVQAGKLSILEQYILEDLIDILQYLGHDVSEDKTVYDQELSTIVKSIQQDYGLPSQDGRLDGTTFRVLLNLYPTKQDQFSRISTFLFDWQQSHSYQRARYDGYLQGTEVGMNLFYTDLVMKLWSFNYQNSAPEAQVPGFESLTSGKLDFTYYEEMQRLTGTRSWLGELPSGRYIGANEVYFAHCATRIFNASSSDLFPGSEVEANFKSFRFADWWNHNYSRVADYDQEFHRLNQIMKWSIIVGWLKEKDLFQVLDRQRIRRDLDFESWYAETNLVVQDPMPFQNRRQLGESTECLKMINSSPHFPFVNADVISRFSGGVSLGSKGQVARAMRTRKAPSVAQSSFARGGIDYLETTSPYKIAYQDGRVLELLPDQKQTTYVVNAEKHRAAEAELFNVEFSKKIEARDEGLSLAEEGGGRRVFTLDLNSTESGVSMTYQPGEIMQGKRLLKAMESTDGRAAFESDLVRQSYLLPDENQYYVQLTANDQWMRVTTQSGDAVPGDLRVGKDLDRLLGQVNYLDGRFVDRAELVNDAARYEWIETSVDYTGSLQSRFSGKPASSDSRALKFYLDDAVLEAKVGNRSIKIKNDLNTGSNSLDVLEAVKGKAQKESIELLSSGLPDDPTAIKFSYTENGKVLGVTAGKFRTADRRIFQELIPNGQGQVRSLVMREGGPVRIIGDDVLQLPKSPTPKDMQLAREVVELVNADATWATKVWKNVDRITPEDLAKLRQVNPAHPHLRDTYYQFKAVDKLDADVVVADLNIAGEQPQIMILRNAGAPEVINLGTPPAPMSARTGGRRIRDFLDGKSFLNKEQLLENTRPIADGIEKVIETTGGTKTTIVTTRTEGINTTLISKLHNIDPRYKVYKDQPDIEASAQNAKTVVYADLPATRFLSTVPFEEVKDDTLAGYTRDIYAMGVAAQTGITIDDFKMAMADDSIRQAILVVRANDDGLIFTDGTFSYEALKKWLQASASSKDLLYVVSNQGEEMQQYFAESGKFTFVLSSDYQQGSVRSLHLAFENMRGFWQRYAGATLDLNEKGFKKLSKKFNRKIPELGQLLANRAQRAGNRIRVGLSGLTERQRALFSTDYARKQLNKYTGGGYEIRDLRSALDEAQLEQIRKLEVEGTPNRLDMDRMRAIPDLKCEVSPSDNPFKGTC